MQQGRAQRQIELKYRHFEGLCLAEPIDWRQDPFESRNWVHHFLSLRWIEEFPPTDMAWILRDFFSWMDANDSNRQFLAGRRRDHTTAIRMVVLDRVSNTIDAAKLRERIDMEVKRGLDELVFSDTYKFGHNHGLLIDEAVLAVLAHRKNVGSNRRLLSAVLDRLLTQIDSLFDQHGFSREHSVSYQEYNLATLESISGHLEVFEETRDQMSSVRKRIAIIRSASLSLLGAALRRNGEYIPFGDSFRRPNGQILKRAFGSAEADLALASGMLRNSSLVAPVAGFGFWQLDDARTGKWHFGLTSAHNVASHKQHDDLSIFVEQDGVVAIDDSGYTDADDEMRRWCRSRAAHSACTLLDERGKWITTTERRRDERWVKRLQLDACHGLIGKAEFRTDAVLWRALLLVPAIGLLVLDWHGTMTSARPLNHRFIFGGPDKIWPHPDAPSKSSGCLQMVPEAGLGAPEYERIQVGGTEKSQPEPRVAADWRSTRGLAGFLLQPVDFGSGQLNTSWRQGSIVVRFENETDSRLLIPAGKIEQNWEMYSDTLILE